MVTDQGTYRLTQYAHGGGCACKIPPGELEEVVRGLGAAAPRDPVGELLVGLESGDDAAAVLIAEGTALIATTDFLTPTIPTTGAESPPPTRFRTCTRWADGRW